MRPCCPRIAPCSALKSFAPDTDCSVFDAGCSAPSLDCSTFDALHLCTVCGLLRARYLTLRAGLRIAPYANTLRPCVAHGLLRAQHFKLRAEPDYSVLDAWHSMQDADCSALFTLCPCVDCGLLRRQHLEFCVESVDLRLRHLSLRTGHELLHARHLALICCLRIAPHSSLSARGAGHGLLRAQHLVLRAGTLRQTMMNRHE